MSYNIFLDIPAEAPWRDVHAMAMSCSKGTEAFPISDGDSNNCVGLGLSLPMNAATETGWKELRSLLVALMTISGVRVHDLHTGQEVTVDTIDTVRSNLLGY